MKLRHRLIAAAGVLPTASCAPTPVAHRGSTAQAPAVADPQPVTAGDRPDDEGVPTSSSSAPVPTTEPLATIATVSGLPPMTDGTTTTTVRPKPLSTTTLPENVDEAMSDVEWAIRSTFPETPDRAVRIARCESRLNPDALNGEHVGIMQIATKVHARLIAKLGYTVGDLFGIRANLHVARAIFDGADGGPVGWSAWSCTA